MKLFIDGHWSRQRHVGYQTGNFKLRFKTEGNYLLLHGDDLSARNIRVLVLNLVAGQNIKAELLKSTGTGKPPGLFFRIYYDN